MPDNTTTNLPILDDIIKTGDTDKALAQPARKTKSSIQPGVETAEPSAVHASTEIDSHTAIDAKSDPAELFTDDQPRISVPTDAGAELPVIEAEPSHQPSPVAGDIRQQPLDIADLDAITDEILAKMMPELEQLLRIKIRQTLKNRVSDGNGHG